MGPPMVYHQTLPVDILSPGPTLRMTFYTKETKYIKLKGIYFPIIY
jgi:hypothetical protein